MTNPDTEQTTVVTVDTPADSIALFELATGYWASAALLAANDLGIFMALADGSHIASEVAHALQTDPDATERLMDACCALNLLVKQGDRYLLPSFSAAFLVPGRPGYMGDALRWARDQYAVWGNLTETVQGSTPQADREPVSSPPSLTRVIGMRELAMSRARDVVAEIDLEGHETLLNIDGGSGTYASLLTQKYPALNMTLFGVGDSAKSEGIAEALDAGRVEVAPGDAAQAEFSNSSYDAVLFSDALLGRDHSTIGRLLSAAYRALTPGGSMNILDLMLDATRTQPVSAVLFSLQMLLTDRKSRVFTAEECAAWLEEIGLSDLRIRRFPPFYVLIIARK